MQCTCTTLLPNSPSIANLTSASKISNQYRKNTETGSEFGEEIPQQQQTLLPCARMLYSTPHQQRLIATDRKSGWPPNVPAAHCSVNGGTFITQGSSSCLPPKNPIMLRKGNSDMIHVPPTCTYPTITTVTGAKQPMFFCLRVCVCLCVILMAQPLYVLN